MKILLTSISLLFLCFALESRSQSIDYGMTAYRVESSTNMALPVNTGGFRLYTTNGSFTPSSGSSILDITSNMLMVLESHSTISSTDAGLFYMPSLFPATASGNITMGSPLFVLASTTSTFDGTAPWALITGNDVGWFSPNPSDPLASSIIELSLAGNQIVSAGFGGPGVGAFWSPSGPGAVTVQDSAGASLVFLEQPFMVLEQSDGVSLVSDSAPLPFAERLGVISPQRVYTIRNTGSAILRGIHVSKSDEDTGPFSLTTPATNSLAPRESVTFSISFTPTSSGPHTARLSVTSSDTNIGPFLINLSGFGIGVDRDTDGDGLNDAAEFAMSVLGFDWQSKQPTLVAALYNNANSADLFTRLQYDSNRTNGQSDVTANPSAFNLFTQSQYDSNRTNGQSDVTANPSAFNLFTQSQYDSNRTNGQSDVTANPSAFNLFTQSQFDGNRTAGQQDVLLNPATYGLQVTNAVPTVELYLRQSTPLRVTLAGSNLTGIFVDELHSPLPDDWQIDKQQGHLFGAVNGTNTISVVLEGMMQGGGSVRIPLNFYPQRAQTVGAFARIPDQAFRLQPLTVARPTNSSGLPVVLSVKSGPATISGNLVTLTNVGTVVLAANHPGNQMFLASREVTTSFRVVKGAQTINFAPLSALPFVQGGNLPINASATSGLPVTLTSSRTNVVRISGATASIQGRGTATITATQAGDARWNAARAVSRTLTVQ